MDRVQRIIDATFDPNSIDPTPPHTLLSHLTIEDVKTADTNTMETLQHHIGATLTHQKDGDPRWLQIYIAGLMRNVDFMANAVLDDVRAIEIAQHLSLAIAHARDAITPPHHDATSPTTIVGTMSLCILAITAVVALALLALK